MVARELGLICMARSYHLQGAGTTGAHIRLCPPTIQLSGCMTPAQAAAAMRRLRIAAPVEPRWDVIIAIDAMVSPHVASLSISLQLRISPNISSSSSFGMDESPAGFMSTERGGSHEWGNAMILAAHRGEGASGAAGLCAGCPRARSLGSLHCSSVFIGPWPAAVEGPPPLPSPSPEVFQEATARLLK